eukprot:365720-Chlamydomonas_euryale.AAC.13
MAVKLDGVLHDEALNLPRVAKVEPVVGLLMLEPIDDALAEHAIESRHRVEEAGRQAAKAAIAERRVSLPLRNLLQLVAQLVQCLRVRAMDVEIVQRVQQAAAHQELHAAVHRAQVHVCACMHACMRREGACTLATWGAECACLDRSVHGMLLQAMTGIGPPRGRCHATHLM